MGPLLVSLINHEYQHDCWVREVRALLGRDTPLDRPPDTGAVAHPVSATAEEARAAQAAIARIANRERFCCCVRMGPLP